MATAINLEKKQKEKETDSARQNVKKERSYCEHTSSLSSKVQKEEETNQTQKKKNQRPEQHLAE